jgi:hypothetical protein
MTNGPVLTVTEDQPAPAHELEDIVARLHDLALKAFAAADQVADLLVLFGGGVNQNEAIVSEVTGDLDRVPTVGLPMLARSPRDQRRCRQMALDVPLDEGTLEHVAGA